VGDELVEIETDKATMSYAAEAAGILRIVAPVGTSVAVGDPIASLDGAPGAPVRADGTAGLREDAAADAQAAREDPEAVPASAQAAPDRPAAARNGSAHGGGGAAARATPVARRLAALHGIDLGALEGTGPGGRILKSDVAAAAGVAAPQEEVATPRAEPAAASEPAAPPPAAAPGARGEVSVIALTRLQQLVARRMAEVKATVPEFQVETDVDMAAVLDLRRQLKAQAGDDPAPSLNDIIVKACAAALRRHPRANAGYRDGSFELFGRVNVGIAVAAEDALVVPTIFDADQKSLGQIGREARRLAARVRDGSITPPELAGGTFTVSNLGMFGMTAITPVINAGQAAILGVGTIRQLLARGPDGDLVDRHLLTLRLSCDHRILYGADAARFLADIRENLSTRCGSSDEGRRVSRGTPPPSRWRLRRPPTTPNCWRLPREGPRACLRTGMRSQEERLEETLSGSDRPYQPHRDGLYTRDELMAGWGPGDDHSTTLDARIYRHVKDNGGRAPDVIEGLAQRTHDHFMDVALAEYISTSARPVIGIMGGSKTVASDPNYRRVVALAALLTERGYLVVRGGGLGIMEAANLGAYLANRSRSDRDDALGSLAEAPPFASDQASYIRVAVEVRTRFGPGGESLAIPTWVYEGEPISQFASHIAKYFSNSIREDGLLAVATAGVVFAPGGAGTMQEIFQDAAQNAYRTFGRSPMVFLDRQHYCAETGLYPLLQRQADRLGFADLLAIDDEPEAIADHFDAQAPRSDPGDPPALLRRMRNMR